MTAKPSVPPLIPTVDTAILALLPDEGAVVGLRPLGIQVKGMIERLGGQLTGPELNGRLQTLHWHDYVVPVHVIPASKGMGWQITPRGTTYLKENK